MTGSAPSPLDRPDHPVFYRVQTQTGWSRTLAAFAAWCQPQPGSLALDVGCGPGLLPALLERHGCRAYGVDIDPAAFCPDKLHPKVLVANAEQLPFVERAFDLVTSSNLLFLMKEPPRVLIELARMLKPGGQIALLNPSEHLSIEAAAALADRHGLEGLARDTLINWAARAEASFRWTEPDLVELFTSAGLQLEEAELKVGVGLARFVRGKLITP